MLFLADLLPSRQKVGAMRLGEVNSLRADRVVDEQRTLSTHLSLERLLLAIEL